MWVGDDRIRRPLSRGWGNPGRLAGSSGAGDPSSSTLVASDGPLWHTGKGKVHRHRLTVRRPPSTVVHRPPAAAAARVGARQIYVQHLDGGTEHLGGGMEHLGDRVARRRAQRRDGGVPRPLHLVCGSGRENEKWEWERDER